MFLSGWIANRFGESFPWGTLVVNASGCFVIGFFAGLTGPDGVLLTSPLTRQVVALGLLGGFTTYSSFSLQTINLLSEGQILHGLGNIFLTLLLCLAGTWLGLILAGALQPK
jgi:CrcB protein